MRSPVELQIIALQQSMRETGVQNRLLMEGLNAQRLREMEKRISQETFSLKDEIDAFAKALGSYEVTEKDTEESAKRKNAQRILFIKDELPVLAQTIKLVEGSLIEDYFLNGAAGYCIAEYSPIAYLVHKILDVSERFKDGINGIISMLDDGAGMEQDEEQKITLTITLKPKEGETRTINQLKNTEDLNAKVEKLIAYTTRRQQAEKILEEYENQSKFQITDMKELIEYCGGILEKFISSLKAQNEKLRVRPHVIARVEESKNSPPNQEDGENAEGSASATAQPYQQPEHYTVAVINELPSLDSVADAFTACMKNKLAYHGEKWWVIFDALKARMMELVKGNEYAQLKASEIIHGKKSENPSTKALYRLTNYQDNVGAKLVTNTKCWNTLKAFATDTSSSTTGMDAYIEGHRKPKQ